MARKYKKLNTYFDTHPEIVKIFDDLEKYLDYCRTEWKPYNPCDLYNRESYVWRCYEKFLKSSNTSVPKRTWRKK